MTNEKNLRMEDPPLMGKFSVWAYAFRINMFFKKKSIEKMGLVDPINVEKSGNKAIQLLEAEFMEQPRGSKLPGRPLKAVFLPDDDVCRVFVRAIAHFSFNKEMNMMKRFAFGPSNKIKT